jgi:FkbM family methyltransferase
MSEVEAWLEPHLPPRGTGLALDIGANAGHWTTVLADRCEEVHAFEPNPQCHHTLRGRTAARRNVRLCEFAVGDDIGDIALRLYPNHAHATAFDDLETLPRGDRVEMVSVPVVSLDQVGYQWRTVDYIKIDTEGAERHIVQGAAGTLLASMPQLLIECHTAANRDWLIDTLTRFGYQPEHLPHPHAGVPDGHCWVVCERPHVGAH